MAQLGYGSISEQQHAEKTLKQGFGISSVSHAARRIRNPRRVVPPEIIGHITTAYGQHPTIAQLLLARSQSAANPSS